MIELRLKTKFECLRALPGGRNELAVIPAGVHEMERVPNPIQGDEPWLVVKGTMVGGSEWSFRNLIEGPGTGFDRHAVVLVEDGVPVKRPRQPQ